MIYTAQIDALEKIKFYSVGKHSIENAMVRAKTNRSCLPVSAVAIEEAIATEQDTLVLLRKQEDHYRVHTMKKAS
jgi:hypothetical protein